MTNPRIIQQKALSKVSPGKPTIIAVHTTIPKIGNSGTIGVLNGRFKLGSFLRRIITPRQTNTNANSVPIEVRSPATLTGTNAANNPTNTNNTILLLYGVRNFG